jgi:hypothetical protein
MPRYGSNCGCPHWMGHHLRESGDVAHRVGPVEPHDLYLCLRLRDLNRFISAPLAGANLASRKALSKSTASRHCSPASSGTRFAEKS